MKKSLIAILVVYMLSGCAHTGSDDPLSNFERSVNSVGRSIYAVVYGATR